MEEYSIISSFLGLELWMGLGVGRPLTYYISGILGWFFIVRIRFSLCARKQSLGKKTHFGEASLPSASVNLMLMSSASQGWSAQAGLCAWAHMTAQSVWKFPKGPGREGLARSLIPLREQAYSPLEPSLQVHKGGLWGMWKKDKIESNSSRKN